MLSGTFNCFDLWRPTVSHYIKPGLNLMAIQTLNKNGHPVDVIPATPDADPDYHTGLSIIDYLELCL